MSVLSFFKDVGANIFGKGKKETEAITELLNKDLPGQISNLKVEFDKGIVTLGGTCDSHATKEKAVLLAGNVKGVESVNDALEAPDPVEPTEFYTIKKGDTLSRIAKNYYGSGSKYPVIFEANREVIKDPDLIYPGQVVRIPKL
jgi:nucleoid-associated protein YgaU